MEVSDHIQYFISFTSRAVYPGTHWLNRVGK